MTSDDTPNSARLVPFTVGDWLADPDLPVLRQARLEYEALPK